MASSKEKKKSFSNTFLNRCKAFEAVKIGMPVSAAVRASPVCQIILLYKTKGKIPGMVATICA
jgi:hypothetical protein